jgi:hypothetical protein
MLPLEQGLDGIAIGRFMLQYALALFLAVICGSGSTNICASKPQKKDHESAKKQLLKEVIHRVI